MADWSLSLTTYAGSVPGASHWMVRIGRDDLCLWTHQMTEIEYECDADQAAALSEPDYAYEIGWTTARFMSREAAVTAGIERFLADAEPGDVLYDARPYLDARLILTTHP